MLLAVSMRPGGTTQADRPVFEAKTRIGNQGNRVKDKMNRQNAKNTKKKRREKRKSEKPALLKPRIESW
jgi:hypothetical protein